MPLLFQILVVFYLPGALLFRLPGLSQARRAELPAEERLFWAVMLSGVWSFCVVLALAALGRYTFERLLIANAVVALVLLAFFRRRLAFSGRAAGPTWSALVPAALLAIGAWLSFPPAEYVVGGRDPGVYVNEGVQIAQRGEIVLHDQMVASIPRDFRDLFFPSHQQPTYYGLRFVGFWIQDPDEGTVVGQFPHLFPASIAVGYGLNGLSGARQAAGFWAMAGLLAVYFAGSRLFGRMAAAAATALLAVNVVQIWFARYPNAEGVMQSLLFCALLAFGRSLDGQTRFFGSVAGALGGLLLFLRYDAVLLIASLAMAATISVVVNKRARASFWILLTGTSVIGFVYLFGPMRAYAAYPLAFMRSSGMIWVVAAGLVLLWVAPRVLPHRGLASAVTRAGPPALALALGGLAIYAYFFRHEGGRLAAADAAAFRSFGWYMTAAGLGLATLGSVVLTWRRFWSDPGFFLTFATFSVFFFYKLRIVPEHFWAARRFLPVILPAALLLACALLANAAFWIADRVGRRSGGFWSQGLAVLLLVAALTPLASAFWSASAEVRHHVEYAGLIPRLEQLAGRFDDRDLVIVEARNAGTDLHVLATPLAYIYARNVLLLDSVAPSKDLFEAFVAWARTRYRAVWFLGGGGTDLLTANLAAVSVASESFQVPEYDAPLNGYPRGVRRKEFEYGLYRLEPSAPPADGPVVLTIGANDDLHVVRFHAKERHGETGETFRWSGPQSFVVLQRIGSSARELTLWMSNGGRPARAPAPEVELALDAAVLGTATPDDAVRAYSFPLPPDLVSRLAASDQPVRLRLRVPTWNPALVLGLPDTRDLGVIVTRVEVR
jgi:hypothetical protein